MTPDDREARLARSRYRAITLIQIGGTLVALLGLVVWNGDQLRPGGWPELGIPIFLIGVVDALLMPKLLTKRWKSPPTE